MNIIIPIGGVGARFQIEGYSRPKPLINVLGKPMIYHVIDNLCTVDNDIIYIVYNGDLDKFDFGEEVHHHNSKIHLISTKHRTRGAAETVLIGLDSIENDRLPNKTIVIDCDTFYTYNIVNKFRNQTDNAVFCFVDLLDDPIYSYIKFTNTHTITDIKEKEKISNYANTGCYCFASGNLLKQYCNNTISDYENNTHSQKELYMSGVIHKMINDRHIFKANIISNGDFHCLGTPIQLKIFCCEHSKQFAKNIKLRICFDLDRTLVSYPEVDGDYSTVKPIYKTIKLCRYLKSLGHHIIIHTARRMKTFNGNVGSCIANIGLTTIETLRKFDIPYDELLFGKPYADYYIDDLSLDPRLDLERELGLYMTKIQEREFNNIIATSDNIVTKTGNSDKIKGEIYWYNNIPRAIKNYFPIMYSHSPMYDRYDMEKICGIALSYLYTTESMTPKVLTNYLTIINTIHNSSVCVEQENIYANYCDKIQQRYANYDYSKFQNSEAIYSSLIKYFTDYEKNSMGLRSVIHGDPVFSNCILNEFGQFKLIDMRGLQGNKETIFGDKWYDYGKIYQSIIGYDEILLDKTLSIDYKTSMIDAFTSYIETNFGSDIMHKIKMITNSLLFTLIPLHDDCKCVKYFKLIQL